MVEAQWLPLPGVDIEVEHVPWWLYVLGAITLMVVGAALRALTLPWRDLLGGDSLPRKTVDLMIQAKDAELARAILDRDQWMAAYNLEHRAYQELAQSVDASTRALEELNPQTERPPGGSR
jgi:hypothetical protein